MRQRNRYDPLPSEDQDLVKVHQPSTIKKKLLNPVTHFLPEQFNLKERPIPWKAIGYATILFILGTILLLCGCLIHVGHIDNQVSFEKKFSIKRSPRISYFTFFCRDMVIDYGL